MTATAPSPAPPRLDGARPTLSPPGVTGLRLAWAIALVLLVTLNVWPSFTGDQLGPPLPWAAIVGLPVPFIALLLGVQASAPHGAPGGRDRHLHVDERVLLRRRAARWLAIAGLVLLATGLTLGLVQGGSHDPSVVGGVVAAPAVLGVALLCAAPVALLPARWLPWVAVALALAGPPLSQLVRSGVPVYERFIDGSPSWFGLQAPGVLLLQLGFAGLYPALSLVVLVVAGIAIGRTVIGRGARTAAAPAPAVSRLPVARIGGRLVIGGLASIAAAAALVLAVFVGLGGVWALTVLWPGAQLEFVWSQLLVPGRGSAEIWSPIFLLTPAPRTGTIIDLAVSGGAVVALLGLALLVGAALDSRAAGRGARLGRAASAATGIGRAPITILLAHTLGALAVPVIANAFPRPAPTRFGVGFAVDVIPWWMSSPWVWLAHVVVMLAIGAACAAADRDGPVERLIGRLAGTRPTR